MPSYHLTATCPSASSGTNRMASSSRTEHYRQLARECLQIAQTLPPGDGRDTVLDMAREWERLADQQEHATDLRRNR